MFLYRVNVIRPQYQSCRFHGQNRTMHKSLYRVGVEMKSLKRTFSVITKTTVYNAQFTPSRRAFSTASTPTVLVYGGNGALGQSVVTAYNNIGQYNTINVDYTTNNDAAINVVLDKNLHWKQQCNNVLDELADKQVKLQSVVCVAGGWVGGSIDKDTIFDTADVCIQQHIYSALSAGHIASQLSTHHSLNVFTGSSAVLHNQAGNETMSAYTLAKSSIHTLVKTLALKHNGLPANTVTIGIAPKTLDTPNNRKFMPDSDFGTWTKRELIAEFLVRLSLMQLSNHYTQHNVGQPIDLNKYKFEYNDEIKQLQLVNGGLYDFETKNNKTQIQVF